jgi:hypothetical protein
MEKHPSQRPVRNRRPDTTDALMFEPEFATFKIGPEERIFKVYRWHACHYVPSFRAAFNNKACIEGETQIYTLKDTTPAVFRIFMHWLYAQSLEGPIWKVPRPLPTFTNHEEGVAAYTQQVVTVDEEFSNVIQLWVLADYLLLPKLQNLAMDELDRLCSAFGCFNQELLVVIWDQTAEESPLRRYFIDGYAKKCDFKAEAEKMKHLRSDILMDFLVAMQHFRKVKPKDKLCYISYHVPVPED